MSANLAELLDATAARSPDDVAIVFEGSRTTFAQLNDQATRLASALAVNGVVPGDRVALLLPNHPAFAAAMYGTWRCGATVVPVHSALTGAEVRHIVSDCEAKIVFCGPDQEEIARSLATSAPSIERVVALGPEYISMVESGGPSPIAEVSDDDLALIAYTAGTSGLPKGAMLTHGNLRSNIEQMRQTPIAIGPEDVVLCVLPLFHIFGLNVVLNLAVSVGARVVLMERFDPRASLDAIGGDIVTVIAGPPQVYVAWLAQADAPPDAFSNVRIAISGAAPLSKAVLNAFRERFDVTIWEGYGLTETAPALTFTGIGGVPKAGSVGRPLPGVELRLEDEDGDEVELGDPGEIVVRGPNVFKGYWRKEDETARVLVDGWFRTGDVGIADDDGDIYIVDRRRDMVLVSGFNVYPREIEDVLRRHPKVGDCAVVGAPDPQTGEHVRAIVVPDPPGEGVTEGDIVEFLRKSLAPYKLPKEIEFVSEIPRNAAGKVLRRELR
jgi:long-chain acyl-CoA synthetase